MNFAALLSTGPMLKSAPVKAGINKSAAHIKAANSMREAGNQRYRKAFALYPDMTASTVQIANQLGQTPSPTVKQLGIMSDRENPVVVKVGEIPHARNGCPTFIWKWIGK